MKFSKLSVIAMLGVAAMSSCSSDNELTSEKSEYVTSVRVTVEDFLPESPASRTSYTVDASGFNFHWADGDALGIYPIGGDQVKFPISQGDGSASASFDGGAWKLRSTYQYAAYYPFSADNYKIDQKALPANFNGQTQNGNGSTAHLGAYDYLACAATSPSAGGGVDLTMKHLGAFVRLQFTMPKADTFSSVVLESDGAQFVTSGTFDLTAATPAITPTATSSTYSINLTNVATTEKDQVVTVYAIVAPANLSTSQITVTVHGAGQATYVQTVPGKNFAARRAYNIAVETFPSGTNASGEDVSWEEPATTGIENGHEWVDLGLPSGIKWATCNVGATSPEEYGNYYAWGETEPKDDYSWRTYLKSIGGSMSDYKDCGTNRDPLSGFVKPNYKSIAGTLYDVAYVKWGGTWNMPTKEQFSEMINNCYWCWTTNYNGKTGYIVYKAKSESDKGKLSFNTPTLSAIYTTSDTHIFLPAAGSRNGTTLSNEGNGYYWSASPTMSYEYWEYGLWFRSPETLDCFSSSRECGESVRPVCQ